VLPADTDTDDELTDTESPETASNELEADTCTDPDATARPK
jgi:hypothetical protein